MVDLQSNMATSGEILKNIFKSLTDEMQMCIQNCIVCHQSCAQMINHCLQKGGLHASPDHIRTLMDCAEICSVAADFMIRNSDLHPSTCRVCAEVCMACAQSCERLDSQDEMMKSCAEICRQCADSCEKMAVRQ